MKKIFFLATLTAILLGQLSAAIAENWDKVTKEKKVHNQYTVQDMDKLVIDNVFGRVHINTWDKNEVTVDIQVTVKAKTESAAQEILDHISFVISSNEDGGHRIYYKTVLENARHNNQNSEMTIDYTINAPKKNAIDITNKFGDVYLGDFSGKMRMNVSYGALDMQTITGTDKRIKVAFGSGIIHSIETANFDISYTDISIDNARDIDVANKYGKLDIGTVNELKIDQRYGDISIISVSNIIGSIDYANLEIDNLLQSAELTLKYSGKTDIKNIGAGAYHLNIVAHYSDLFFGFAEGANLDMDIKTSYSDISKGSFSKGFDLVVLNTNGIGNAGHYHAKIGKAQGNMTIDAHYSNIKFR